MSQMFYIVLCVVFLVKQINMMPFGIQEASDIARLSSNQPEEFTNNLKMNPIEVSRNVKLLLEMTEKSSIVQPVLVEDAAKKPEKPLRRVRRSFIKNRKCPKDHARLWRKGPCVTCEVYMDRLDADECPGASSR